MFDTLKSANELLKAGFSRNQAETQVRVMQEFVTTHFATKQDLKDLEHRLTIKMGGMFVAAITILAALMKLLH